MLKKISHSLNIQQPLLVLFIAAIALTAGFGVAHATLLSGADLISAPDIISDDPPGAVNERQQAFDERQGVTLQEDLRCDTTILQAGETVNSHMIFFNTRFNSPETDANRTWTFDDEIICVMSNSNGLYQAVSDHILGAPGTSYPGPFPSRGFETGDSYTINGNEITVTMVAEEPGDWIRVVTREPIPDDTTPPVVYCAPGTNPGGNVQENQGQGKGNENGNFVELIGADETDGAVDLYLTDTQSGETFGPFETGTQVQVLQNKGGTPGQEEGKGALDFTIRTTGELTINATDEADNEGSEVCTS